MDNGSPLEHIHVGLAQLFGPQAVPAEIREPAAVVYVHLGGRRLDIVPEKGPGRLPAEGRRCPGRRPLDGRHAAGRLLIGHEAGPQRTA